VSLFVCFHAMCVSLFYAPVDHITFLCLTLSLRPPLFFIPYSGGVCAYWKDVFADTSKLIPNFGTTPNAATHDSRYREKREACHADPNHPFKFMDAVGNITNYNYFLWVIAEIIKTHFMSRSSKEPSEMVIDDFEFFVQTEGEFVDCNAFILKSNHNGQKNADITLSNHTHRDREDDRLYVPVYQVSDDPMSEYNLVHKFFHQVLPPKERIFGPARIFRYIASNKQIKVSIYSVSWLLMCTVCCLLLCFYTILIMF
jgi:hypothetical protein